MVLPDVWSNLAKVSILALLIIHVVPSIFIYLVRQYLIAIISSSIIKSLYNNNKTNNI